MSNDVKITITGDDKPVRAAFDRLENRMQKFRSVALKVGVGLAGIGTAGILIGKSFVQAALIQQKAEATLGAIVDQTGASWEKQRESILAATAALQQKTAVGDEKQLAALARMIPILGSVDKAMAALPVVIDAAAASGRDIETVATTLTRALGGQANVAESVGITFDELAGFGERVEITLGKIGGAAAAAATPFDILKSNIGDLAEVIGESLLPGTEPLAEDLNDIVLGITAWIKENPGLSQGIAAVSTVVVPLSLVVGTLALGIAAVTTVIGPVMIALGVLAGLTGIGLLVAAIVAFNVAWNENWGGIQEKTEAVVDAVVGFLSDMGSKIEGFINNLTDLFAPFSGMFGVIEAVRDMAREWDGTWSGMLSVFSGIASDIGSMFSSAFGWLLPDGALQQALHDIRREWDFAWDAIANTSDIWGDMKREFNSAFDWLKSGGSFIKDLINVSAIWDVVWGAIKTTGETIWNAMKTTVDTVWGAIKTTITTTIDAIKFAINVLIDGINLLIKGINAIPNIGPVGIPDIPKIEKLGTGGIVTKPTIALIGERGPEAVIPLTGNGGGGMGLTVIVDMQGAQIFGMGDFDARVRQGVRDCVR